MRITSETIQQVHKGIVVLNNVAVSLMTKNCHRQAMQVLKDALTAMKIFQAGGLALEHFDVNPLLAKAARIMANTKHKTAYQSAESTMHVRVLEDRVTEMNLQMVQKMCQEATLTQTVPKEAPTQITAIRIELNDFDDTSPCHHLFTSVILMHNYGLSLACVANIGGLDDRKTLKMREAALNFFTIGFSLLSHESSLHEVDLEGDYFHLTKLLFLEVVVLSQLYQSFIDADMAENAAACLSEMQSRCTALQAIDISDFVGFVEKTAPAA